MSTWFYVKNINSYLSEDLLNSLQVNNHLNNLDDEKDNKASTNEQQLKECSEFNDEELKIQIDDNNREDCKEELIIRNKEKQLREDTSNEYNKFNNSLIEFVEFYSNNDILDIISSSSIALIKNEIIDFERDLEEYNNIEEIDSLETKKTKLLTFLNNEVNTISNNTQLSTKINLFVNTYFNEYVYNCS